MIKIKDGPKGTEIWERAESLQPGLQVTGLFRLVFLSVVWKTV